MNYFIPNEISSVEYTIVYDEIDFIKHSPAPVYMAKVDIESPFRIIPASPIGKACFSHRGFLILCYFFRVFLMSWTAPVGFDFTVDI